MLKTKNTNNLVNIMLNDMSEILTNIRAYKNVGATLSDETLLKVCGLVRAAKDELETGFVNDACKEIESLFN